MRRLRTRMIAMIGVPTLVIYVAVLGLTLLHLRGQARQAIDRELTRLATNYAARFDGAFREAAAIAVTTARIMETAPRPGRDRIVAILAAGTLQNPVVYGAAMAFEPDQADPGADLFCPYVCRAPDGIRAINIGRDVYDWHADEKWQWWHRPRMTGRGAWTDPYFDEGAGNVLMVTFGEPFAIDGRFAGVATVDIMLASLQQTVGGEILGDLDFVIVNGAGQYVFNPDVGAIMTQTVADIAAALDRPDLAALGRRLVAGEAGAATIEAWDRPERTLVAFAPIRSTGWSFAARMSEREALAEAHAQARKATLALAVTLALIIGCICFVAARITRPIRALRGKVLEIAGGNLDARIETVRSRDEIGDLAASFNRMTAELRENLDRLARERASREKMERDMDLAREIQRGLLPRTPPDVPGFQIAGWNLAADKTGGDYFDWLQLPDGSTVVTLADVTGHGIGPALIVAVCRAYMRASTVGGVVDLSEVVGRINDLLISDLPDGRFVTAVVGMIDPRRSEMALLSAGHAPLLYFDAGADELHTWAADTLPLGLVRGLPIEPPRTITFKPGDTLVLVTDGFFEWQNARGQQFGISRLEAFVKTNHALPPQELIRRLYDEVMAASGGTEQLDDLTAVVIRRA